MEIRRIKYIVNKIILIFPFFTIDLFAEMYPNFDESMESNSSLYINKYSNDEMKKNISILKYLYDKNNPSIINTEIHKIPKIIHQIWVGPNPIPEEYKIWQKSWIKYHPDWKYILWTDHEVVNLALRNKKLYEETKDFREKADLLRYEILYQFGGLYVDMDFECLKSFEKFLAYDFFAGIVGNEHGVILANGLVGSKPGHPILKKIIENIEDIEFDDWRWRSGVFYFSKKCLELISEDTNLNICLPISYLYVIPYLYNEKEPIDKYIKSETMGLHYWGNKLGKNK